MAENRLQGEHAGSLWAGRGEAVRRVRMGVGDRPGRRRAPPRRRAGTGRAGAIMTV
ncbi:hypothetical protein GLE_3502 [Lysobacter enzymogenes]|uniref:Uncharacterized protein n=1 Tax=Lysobacter enzymogenes TaxID=69 RepID=A0A0S2DKN4_LYSEN|nr:hypothetical protein GLE_3502 [Lysobacter enzymogenes]